MKSKYLSATNLEELDKLLIRSQGDPIWDYRVRSKWSISYLFSNSMVFFIWIYYIRDYLSYLISSLFFLPYIGLAYISNTMKYRIYSNRINFSWGILGRKNVTIPFSDITAINLVEYDNTNISTIYFGTRSEYRIKKFDYENNEPRAHITFENVKDGPEVSKLLHLLWERNKIIDRPD